MISCDICRNHPATVDGKTKMSPWANMCEDCFQRYGIPVKGLYTRFPSEPTPEVQATIAPERVNKFSTSLRITSNVLTQTHSKGGDKS